MVSVWTGCLQVLGILLKNQRSTRTQVGGISSEVMWKYRQDKERESVKHKSFLDAPGSCIVSLLCGFLVWPQEEELVAGGRVWMISVLIDRFELPKPLDMCFL